MTIQAFIRYPGSTPQRYSGSTQAQDGVRFSLSNFEGNEVHEFKGSCEEIDPNSAHLSWPEPKGNAPETTNKEDYLLAINTLIPQLGKGQKTVLSSYFSYSGQFISQNCFLHLLEKYPNALVYLFEFQNEIWLGATPEKLLTSVGKDEYQTTSLAGTKWDSATAWTDKEFEEQQIVTDFIAQRLQQSKVSDIHIGERETIKAGHLEHLSTKINFTANEKQRVEALKALHPTPAVSGFPVEKALNEIKQLEKHNRQWYAGYLGLSDQLFVNLRCGKLFEDGIQLFAGGGVTSLSDPLKEWEEIQQKSKTVLSAITHDQNLL